MTSINRVASLNQTSYMTNQIVKGEANIANLSEQVASGQKSTSYTDYGNQTAAMESARAVVNRTASYQTGTKLALTQTQLQDDQLTQLSDLASQLKTALGNAVSTGDASSLSKVCSGIFDQAAAILNYKDSNGSFIYGGGNDTNTPFAVSSFSDLATATLTDAFQNGNTAKSVQVGDAQTVSYGLAASDVGMSLMTTLQDISSYINTNGDFGSSLTTSQSTFLTDEMSSVDTAYKKINAISADNGNAYKMLQTAADTQDSMTTIYKGFVSDVQDVDMATVSTNLTNAKTALQAVTLVTSSLNDVSLLNYLK